MRRRMVVGIVIVGGLVLGAGLLVWAGTQGLLGPQAKARHALGLAEQAIQHGQWVDAQQTLEAVISAHPDSPWTAQALLKLGRVQEAQQHFVEAKAAYQQLLDRFSNSPLAAEAQTRLGSVNVVVLFSPTLTDSDVVYRVKPGDTLGGIARATRTTTELLKRANGVSRSTIRPGQQLKIPKGTFKILVDKSHNQLFLTQENHFFKTYSVATGKDNSTPVGTFNIINKVPNPVWYRQGAAVPPDSPANILGTRWMGLDKQGYGIHGSVDPGAIGKQVTAGCVRMSNADVEELFTIVPAGTEVTIVD